MPQRRANLSETPSARYAGPPINQCTEGDLHGNTIRLLDALYYYDVIDIDDASYSAIVRAYAKVFNRSASTADESELLALLQNHVIVKNKQLVVRLIGDVIADRGVNDAFTLTLLNSIIEQGANVRSMISNHDLIAMKCLAGATSIEDVERRIHEHASFFGARHQNGQRFGQGDSFLKLFASLKAGQVSFNQIKQQSERYFKTMLLLDYSEENGKLTLYSHAPMNFPYLAPKLAEQFGIAPPNIRDNDAVKRFIHEINLRFQAVVQSNDSHLIDTFFAAHEPASEIILRREKELANNKGGGFDCTRQFLYCYGHDKRHDETTGHEIAPDNAQDVIRIDNASGKKSITSDENETSYACEGRFSVMPSSRMTLNTDLLGEMLTNRVKNKFTLARIGILTVTARQETTRLIQEVERKLQGILLANDANNPLHQAKTEKLQQERTLLQAVLSSSDTRDTRTLKMMIEQYAYFSVKASHPLVLAAPSATGIKAKTMLLTPAQRNEATTFIEQFEFKRLSENKLLHLLERSPLYPDDITDCVTQAAAKNNLLRESPHDLPTRIHDYIGSPNPFIQAVVIAMAPEFAAAFTLSPEEKTSYYEARHELKTDSLTDHLTNIDDFRDALSEIKMEQRVQHLHDRYLSELTTDDHDGHLATITASRQALFTAIKTSDANKTEYVNTLLQALRQLQASHQANPTILLRLTEEQSLIHQFFAEDSGPEHGLGK